MVFKTPIPSRCKFASEMTFSRVTFQIHLNQVIEELVSKQRIHLWWCNHSALLFSEKPDQCGWFLTRPTISYLAGQHTVKLQLRRITCAADDNQNARKWDLQPMHTSDRNNCATPWFTEVPEPKHGVSGDILALAEDKRPEATLLIGVS